MKTLYKPHYSVFLPETLDFLTQAFPSSGDLAFLDMTFGGGGHSFALLEAFPQSRVWAIDQDLEALENGRSLSQGNQLEERITFFHGNFLTGCQEFLEQGLSFSGIIGDLGLSSHQLDSAERGFSFQREGPLDMRMNPQQQELSAADILNTFSEEDLLMILQDYGEEKFSSRIIKKILETRSQQLFSTTKELENLVFHAYPKNLRYKKTHPATQTFQALRIAVNQELDVLEQVIPDLFSLLKPHGLLQLISFHSLEDRIVKTSFKKLKKKYGDEVKIRTKKPLTPSTAELQENNRSRSAKLRVLERTLGNEKKEEKKWKR